MTTIPEQPAPVPFFTDTRTITEKLTAEQREWRPHEPEHDCPSMIFGLVLERGSYASSYRDTGGNNKVHDTARLLAIDNVLWSVIAFHGYLQSEFSRKQPRVGDFVAIAYQGTRPAKKQGESDAHVYQMEVERNPAETVPMELDDRGNELLVGSEPPPAIPPTFVDEDAEGGEPDGDGIPF